MNRRETLLSLSALAGHALFPRVLELASLDTAALAQGGADWRPELLSPGQGRVLAEIVETIIPATDTPGAKAARVHVFADLMLAHCVPSDRRQTAVAAIDALGERFMAASPDDRLAQLQATDADALALLKELTILGYCTSEVGATQALAYVKVPGSYRGCVPLGPDQRAWATR
jgi:hypothetical protein